jgi:hypothetical protein
LTPEVKLLGWVARWWWGNKDALLVITVERSLEPVMWGLLPVVTRPPWRLPKLGE